MAYQSTWSQRVAASLRDAITDSDLSLNKLSELTDIPLSTLFRRYKGVNPWNTEQIEAIAAALECDPFDLLAHQAAS